MSASETRKAVAYRNGSLVEVDAPADWPGVVASALGMAGTSQALEKSCQELTVGRAVGRVAFYRHRTSGMLVALAITDGPEIPILLPTDLDVARFWMDVIHPAEVAENYGVLGASIADHGTDFADLADALRNRQSGSAGIDAYQDSQD